MGWSNAIRAIKDWLEGSGGGIPNNVTPAGRVKFTGNHSVNAPLTVTTSAFTIGTSLIGKTIRFTSTAGSRHKRVTLQSASAFTSGDRITFVQGLTTPSSNGISIVAGTVASGKGLNGTSKLLKSTSRVGIGGSVTIEASGYGWRIAHREYGPTASTTALASLAWRQGAN